MSVKASENHPANWAGIIHEKSSVEQSQQNVISIVFKW